jgi:ABC-type nickel/cobalt efflux system permease component RcnA
MFKERFFALMGWNKNVTQHDHHHGDGHDHHDHTGHTHAHDDGVTHTHGGSTHTHAVPDAITWRSLLALGISGGLLPCPSALVLMLSAIALGRVGYGLILTVAFSFGLAATLTVVGLIFLYVRTFFAGSSLAKNPVFRLLPIASALVITVVGATICYNSFA